MAIDLLDLLKKSCEQVKRSVSLCISQIIHNQYNTLKKKELIDSMVTDFAKGKGFLLRKSYITFCT